VHHKTKYLYVQCRHLLVETQMSHHVVWCLTCPRSLVANSHPAGQQFQHLLWHVKNDKWVRCSLVQDLLKPIQSLCKTYHDGTPLPPLSPLLCCLRHRIDSGCGLPYGLNIKIFNVFSLYLHQRYCILCSYNVLFLCIFIEYTVMQHHK